MKRVERYHRDYTAQASCYGTLDGDKDNTLCAALGRLAEHSGENQFLYFDGNACVVIGVFGKPPRTSWGDGTGRRVGTKVPYRVDVRLVVMPASAETPKELTDLLEEKGFSKAK